MDIVVVTFNRVRYLQKCIASLLDTTPGMDRVIVVDNCSFDETPAFLQEQQKLFPSERFLVLQPENNLGCGMGRNIGFERSQKDNRDEFIFLSDDDFFFYSSWWEICLEAFGQDARLGLVSAYDDHRIGKLSVVQVRPGLILKYRGVLAHGASMIRKKAFRDVGGYPVTGRVMGFFASPFCQRLTATGWRLCIAKADRNLVEHMDLPRNPMCLREYHKITGYDDFQRDAKKGLINVGDDVGRYFKGIK